LPLRYQALMSQLRKSSSVVSPLFVDSSVVTSGGKKEQGPTATLAFPAFLALWFV
jgi:hypothetical protein